MKAKLLIQCVGCKSKREMTREEAKDWIIPCCPKDGLPMLAVKIVIENKKGQKK